MKKTKFIFLLVTFTLAVLAGVGVYFASPQESAPDAGVLLAKQGGFGWKFPITKFPLTGTSPGLLAYSDIRDPGGVPQGLPVRLVIPVIGVDTAIEDALITPDGRMDVPAGSRNVAWFALGPHPGQEGSAVIGGHYGIENGIPFVFYKLDMLVVGDNIYIDDDKGDRHRFVVRSVKLFDRDADATSVFTSSDGLAHLNLITCEGIWNQVNNTYPERRVVFADAIPVPGALAPATAAFHRSLAIGASGSDVESLQAFLEKKGFLTMPAGVSRGYFGKLTSAALAKYQTSVGIPPVGIFGPLTRAGLVKEMTGDILLPSVGMDATGKYITSPLMGGELPSGSRSFMESVKSLYGTPTDAVITFTLLTLVAYVLYKIIRRKT